MVRGKGQFNDGVSATKALFSGLFTEISGLLLLLFCTWNNLDAKQSDPLKQFVSWLLGSQIQFKQNFSRANATLVHGINWNVKKVILKKKAYARYLFGACLFLVECFDNRMLSIVNGISFQLELCRKLH